MKIVGPPSNQVAELGRRSADSSGPVRSGEKAAGGDKVALSETARWLAEWKAAIGDPLEIDEARVAELKREISAGTYDPSPSEIAESLLRELDALRRR
jgi:flagellar biosynthesis anti-sigma factor FlgM